MYRENKAKGKTGTALSKLLSLAPSHAILVDPDSEHEREIPAEFIQANDLLKVLPGSKIPTDGIVVHGSSSVDESLVTGEPIGVKKTVDESVIGGTVNGNGCLIVRATRVGSDTTLSQIVRLVNEAQTAKAPIQAIADRIAGFFVPAVIATGALTFTAWMLLLLCMEHVTRGWAFPDGLEPGDWTSDLFIALNFAISVIVVACPCGMCARGVPLLMPVI